MRYGSVCSGIEAASVAWKPLGWECAFVAEIEKFPSAVLAHRFPGVPNLGDFTKIKPGDYGEDIDLLVGGTPCQAFSVAGLRKGLQDERGNLALEFARLAFRTHARWLVWENVPGVHTSGKGRDFASFLSLLVGWEVPVPKRGWRKAGLVTAAPGCYNVGWRVLDAQYTRVEQFPRAIPQRRKRVLLVGSLVSWADCEKVLFDGEMCGGDAPPRREARQGAAGNPLPGAEGARGVGGKDDLTWWDGGQRAGTITTRTISQTMPDKGQLPCVLDRRWQNFAADGSCPSLLASDYKEPKAIVGDVCPTLDAHYPGKQNNQDLSKLVCYENHPQDGRVKETGEVAPSIPAQAGTGGNNLPLVQSVPFVKTGHPRSAEEPQGWKEGEAHPTLNTCENSEKRVPCVVVEPPKERVFVFDSVASNAMKSKNPKSGVHETDVSRALDTTDPSPAKNQGGMAVLAFEPGAVGRLGPGCGRIGEEVVGTLRNDMGDNRPAVVVPPEAVSIAENVIGRKVENGGNGVGAKEGVCYTLDTVGVHGVCYPIPTMNLDGRGDDFPGNSFGKEGTAAYAITRRRPSGVCTPGVIRKLIPLECERLMGFPDGWTLIPWRKKPAEECPDGPRYKALGNSMCTNVMAWIGERIDKVEKERQDGREEG